MSSKAGQHERQSLGVPGGLEIRILDGLHAGASVSVEPGQTLTVGALVDNDLCLVDAPFATAKVSVTESGWIWVEDNAAAGDKALSVGRGMSAGPLSLVVAQRGTPWPARGEVAIDFVRPAAAGDSHSVESAPAATASEPVPVSEPVASDAVVSAEATAEVIDAPSSAPPSPPERFRTPSRLRAWWLAPGAVAVGVAWFAGQALHQNMGGPDQPRQQPSAVQPTAPMATADDLARIESLLASSGFSDVVRARLRADGRIDILGVLDGVDDQDQLVRLLAAERKWIALRLLSQREFAERVMEASRSLPTGFDVAALPGGRVLLSGLAISDTEVEAAQRALSEALPEMIALTPNVSRPADIAVRLAAQLRDKGLGDLGVNWSGSHIVVDGGISRSAERTLESVLLGFNTSYGDRLATRVTLALTDAATPTGPSAAAALAPLKLPRIVAIQSGSLSYLLFSDGSRVLPGGIVNGYRLASIEDESILFEDRHGNQHRIPR